MYFCIKWLLPFLTWLIFSYTYLGNFFSPAKKISQRCDGGQSEPQ
jgi:hypothetical protein